MKKIQRTLGNGKFWGKSEIRGAPEGIGRVDGQEIFLHVLAPICPKKFAPNRIQNARTKNPKIAPKRTEKDKIMIWRKEQVEHEFDPLINSRCRFTSHS